MSRFGLGHTPNEIVKVLKSKDQATKTEMVKTAYDTLDKKIYDVASLVNAGIIPPLVQILSTPNNSELLWVYKFAILCLIRICQNSHEDMLAVVDGGAIPVLVALINGRLYCHNIFYESEEKLMKYVAIELLGEMAAAGSDIRDEVLKEGAIKSMEPYMRNNSMEGYKAFQAFRNICKKHNDQPVVKLELVLPALPTLAKQLDFNFYRFLFLSATLACSAICDLLEDRENIEVLQAVPELTKNVTKLMSLNDFNLIMAALRVISGMLKGTDAQRDRCLDAGCMEHLITFLKLKSRFICDIHFDLCEGAIEAAADILKGTRQQIRRAIDQHMLRAMLEILSLKNDSSRLPETKKKVLRAVRSIIAGGSSELIDELTGRHLQHFCEPLSAQSDDEELILVLEGLADMLKAKADQGPAELEELCIKLELMNVLDHMDKLQRHEDEQVYLKNMHLIDTYFSMEDEHTQP